MHSLYLATTFAAAIACLLTSLLVFSRSKSGERSRVILGWIILFSVGNYIPRFIALCRGEDPGVVISVPMLVLALFMVISYIVYPIEVISPGYLNFRRVLVLYSPCAVLMGIYALLLHLGVDFPPYASMLDMLPEASHFHVWFRFLLALLILAPVLFIFFIPYTRRYNNVSQTWMLKYTFTLTLNTLAYLVVLFSDALPIKTLYYYVSAGCSIYIAYMELFERLIARTSTTEMKRPLTGANAPTSASNGSAARKTPLSERILVHMHTTSDYRDPDISLNKMAAVLFTNRTTLANALHELGYSSFNSYINTLRVEEFIRRIREDATANYQDVFYDVGFRSRATALRNFKLHTGFTPSEYFSRIPPVSE